MSLKDKLDRFIPGLISGLVVTTVVAIGSTTYRVSLKDVNNDGRDDVVLSQLGGPMIYLQMSDKSLKYIKEVQSEEQETINKKYQKCCVKFDSEQKAIAEKYILMTERAKSLDFKLQGGQSQ